MLLGAVAAQTASKNEESKLRGSAQESGRARALARRVHALLSPMLAFTMVLGTFLGLLAAFLDRPLYSLVDTSLAIILKLPLAVDGRAWSAKEAPRGLHTRLLPVRSILLLQLRTPSVLLSGLGLYFLCVKSTVPQLLRDIRQGVEEGVRTASGRRRNAIGSSGERQTVETATLQRTVHTLWRATAIVQAARLLTLCVAGLVALEWACSAGLGGIATPSA